MSNWIQVPRPRSRHRAEWYYPDKVVPNAGLGNDGPARITSLVSCGFFTFFTGHFTAKPGPHADNATRRPSSTTIGVSTTAIGDPQPIGACKQLPVDTRYPCATHPRPLKPLNFTIRPPRQSTTLSLLRLQLASRRHNYGGRHERVLSFHFRWG